MSCELIFLPICHVQSLLQLYVKFLKNGFTWRFLRTIKYECRLRSATCGSKHVKFEATICMAAH